MSEGFVDTRSRLARMLAGPLPYLAAEVPTGRLAGQPIALRALSADEIQGATRAAYKTLGAAMGADYVLTDVGEPDLNLRTKLEILAMALVEVPPGAKPLPQMGYTRLVTDADELARLLDPDEIDFLFARFNEHQKERSPISHAASWEEVRETVLSMGKGTIPLSRLSGFDASSLRTIVVGLARELATRTRPSFSTTSPSNAPGESGSASSSVWTEMNPDASDPLTRGPSPEGEAETDETAQPPAPGGLTIR